MTKRTNITLTRIPCENGLWFEGFLSDFDILDLDLSSAEMRMLEDCFAPDATPNYWLHALAMLFDKLQRQADERARRAAQTNDNTD
ncbi:hypothetical protein [Burkholderia diffusa]|uniref:hypothetical protein n=1 Tax=Burkholderia diffusa TaxID=488732 RepID=UPI00075814B5|nr:hypothetical protein [Burkholderia diffusa]KVG33857.1 hypothetical protein WJ30_07230 [Burkholderia diffusa]